MTAPTDWKTWVLGVLLTVSMTTTGALWRSNTDRLEAVEIHQQQKEEEDKKLLVDVAVLKAQLSNVQATLDEVKTNQRKMMNEQSAFINETTRNARRWNDAMDRMERQVRR